MKKAIFLSALFILTATNVSFSQSDDKTAELFKLKCGICHTIGGGKLIGPDLANVQERRSEDWLLEYIRSSQSMIKRGDSDAVKLFEEYNKVIMPDPLISDIKIGSLIKFISSNSGTGVGVAADIKSMIEDATEEDLVNGKQLFEGRVRFKNGGPSCYSCHNDLSNVFFSENSYSTKDISRSFADLGELGVKTILKNPPFPVMAKAFEEHKLEEEEIHDLLVFLKNSNVRSAGKEMMASGYLLYGLMGTLLLFFVTSALWYKRKSNSVNHIIYKRQIKSAN